MRKNGRRMIVVPLELGYGMASTGSIPAFSTLVYGNYSSKRVI